MVPGHRNGDILNCCWLLLELGAKKSEFLYFFNPGGRRERFVIRLLSTVS